MEDDCLRRSLDVLQQESLTTILYFSSRPRELGFDHYLYLGHREQPLFDSLEGLRERIAAAAGAGQEDVPGSPATVPAG
jgi:hypothetical protein